MALRLLLVLLAVAAASCIEGVEAGGDRAAPAAPLLPGDAVPALPLEEWLQKGAFDQVRPAGDRLITVAVFFASWDPLSRTVLPIVEARQVELGAQGVRFAAVAEEGREEADRYLRQAKLKHLAVARDEGQAALGLFVDLRDSIPIPYAMLLEGTPGRLVWSGPMVDPAGKTSPTETFDRVLREAMDGRYDVRAAREVAACNRELLDLQDQFCALVGQGKVAELRAAATPALTRTWPAGCEERVAWAFGLPGYLLAAEGEPTKEAGALALQLLDVALAATARMGDTDDSLLHARACALFACGEVAEAAKIEQAVLATPNLASNIEEGARRLLARCGVEPAPPASTPATPPPPNEADRVSPATLSGREAAEDLAALDERLHASYSAYDDTDWALRAAGSSWEQRRSECQRRLEARAEWPTREFFDLLFEYLKVVGDRHLTLIAKLPSAEGVQGRWERPAPRLVAFFAEVRVVSDGTHYRLREVPAGHARRRETELVGVPVIDSPLTGQGGKVYLFPTLPRRRGAHEYLLGVLADPRSAPAELSFAVAAPTGRETVTLPVHRGRVGYRGDDSTAWQIDMQPIPRLSVRTMDVSRTTDLPTSAVTLRQYPTPVLDLRGNGGGGDPIVRDWCALFTDQRLRMSDGWSGIRPGQTDPLRRWNSSLNGLMAWEWRAPAEAAVTPHYAGTLYILADSGTGSAAESFVCLASQIEGAVLLGENTAGCDMYGNRDSSIVLPHSRLQVSYSRSKGMAHGRPFREGVGFFPDYWLDTEDPVGAVVEYLRQR